MWIKKFSNGSTIQENRARGATWLKTPIHGLFEVQLVNTTADGITVQSQVMRGYQQFWHSRTAIVTDAGSATNIAERIQGLRPDGKWDTITWNGKQYIMTVESKALGKPVIK